MPLRNFTHVWVVVLLIKQNATALTLLLLLLQMHGPHLALQTMYIHWEFLLTEKYTLRQAQVGHVGTFLIRKKIRLANGVQGRQTLLFHIVQVSILSTFY